MEIRDPEPETEDVIDLDFCFLGNVQTPLTLVPGKGDSIVWEADHATIVKGTETIQVLKRNLLYFASRERKRVLPVKPLHQPAGDNPANLRLVKEQPVTPTS